MIMNAGFGIFSQISSLNDLDELRVLLEYHGNGITMRPF